MAGWDTGPPCGAACLGVFFYSPLVLAHARVAGFTILGAVVVFVVGSLPLLSSLVYMLGDRFMCMELCLAIARLQVLLSGMRVALNDKQQKLIVPQGSHCSMDDENGLL